MPLLQIFEPGRSAAPHQHRLAAGIDLGTTNSLLASVRSGLAQTLPDDEGDHLLPSVVHYRPDGTILVGRMAQARAVDDPLNTIASVKRFMGRGVDDVRTLGKRLPYEFVADESAMPRIHTAAGDKSPVEVSADILRVLGRRAEQALGGELTGVVITVPAYFDDAQRQATKDAARLAGLHVLRLLNEPTAAALAYGLDTRPEGVIAVFDLGGGTFDISILRLSKGVFEVLATSGDTALGGDDFDRLIAAWMMDQAGVSEGADHTALRRYLRDARGAKEALSEHQSVPVSVRRPDGTCWDGHLSREQFDALVEPLVRKTLSPCRRAMQDAGLEPADIMEVVMVGGSTRVPSVRELVGQFFGREPLVSIDPDRVVAVGAAIQADILAGNKPDDEMLLLDVIPLSLGLETMGGLVEKIMPRNTAIPASKAQDFTTFKDGQTAIALHVVQGERETVDKCRSLARFELRGIPPVVAGAARVRVTFQVDADGLLGVSAKELTSGVQSSISVKPSYGLSDDTIAQMLEDSMAYAREDLQVRRLREEQVEGQRVLEALASALQADGERFLELEERVAIAKRREQLESALLGNDPRAIKRAAEAVEKAAEGFVARRMDSSIRDAMAGHKVDEFQQ